VIFFDIMYNKAIDQFISYCFESNEIKTHKEYPNSIFWIKNGVIIVEIDKSKTFWLQQDIWNCISRMFELNNNDTQSVIKIWLEQHYDLRELMPMSIDGHLLLSWKNIIRVKD